MLLTPRPREHQKRPSPASLLYRKTTQVVSVEDPKVKGVTIWIADYNRSLAAKLAKDFFTEPSQASITCAGA